ncbi:hypothetical protein JQX08_19045 [Pseudomonas sp. UL073]|uniref:Lipoprotein n=1 Tax=Zestomonas insulae TaxID=2809017 RepID=A0ABS2IIC2_9GAMM|nr:hypothetical protein [Pseudomonas insulae]MBM7062816.1 hypothetical protein [Pseudomonas insulae]
MFTPAPFLAPLRIAGLAVLLTLAGCDAAENAAQKLADEAKQQVEQAAREVINDTTKQLNEKIDQAQKSTEDWLDQAPPAERDKAEGDGEAPAPKRQPERDSADQHSA